MTYQANDKCGFSAFASTNTNDTFVASSCSQVESGCWRPNSNITGYGDDVFLATPYSEASVQCLKDNQVENWFAVEEDTSEKEGDDPDSGDRTVYSLNRFMLSLLVLLSFSLSTVMAKQFPAKMNDNGVLTARLSINGVQDDAYSVQSFTPTCH